VFQARFAHLGSVTVQFSGAQLTGAQRRAEP
jgi:hypothetical protein